jgi:hypothetical protein
VEEVLRAAARGVIGADHRFVRAFLDRPEEAVAALVRYAALPRPEDSLLDDADLIALFRALKTAEALPFYLSLARQSPNDLPGDLLDALVDLGAAAVEPLLALYGELEEEESGEIAFVLAGLRVRDERILKLLLGRLDSDPVDAAISLALYGDRAAAPALRRILDEAPAGDEKFRHAIQQALQELEHPSEAVPEEPYDIWQDFPEKEVPDFDQLGDEARMEALGHEDPEFRAAAAHAYFNQSYGEEIRARLFDLARRDADASVRASCWEALLGETEREEIREAMLAVAANREAPLEERSGAAVGLAFEGARPEVAAVFEELYEKPESRAKALEAMWRSLDRKFERYFPRHIEDPDRAVQRQAVLGAGQLHLQSEAGRVEKLFGDDDIRSDALFAYALLAPGETSPARMRALLKRIERLAGGLDELEERIVKAGLDQRLLNHGMDSIFFPMPEEEYEEEEAPAPAAADKVGRNDPCPCGSGKKYKKCCGA